MSRILDGYFVEKASGGYRFGVIAPRMLANFVGVHDVDPVQPSDPVLTTYFDQVRRPCFLIGDGVTFAPIVPRDVIDFGEMRELVTVHAAQTGQHPLHAAIDVATTIDWFAWCVLMGASSRWRPTRDEQDPVWHVMMGKPYMNVFIDFLMTVAAHSTGVRRRVVIDHVLKEDQGPDAAHLRVRDQSIIFATAGVPFASHMRDRKLAECESAVRLAS